jgi:hypothetical protein
MSNFADAMRRQSNQVLTENGGIAYSTTKGGALLDLYAKIGGMRQRSAQDIIDAWREARNENPILADNLVLYVRNIRDCGLGERRIGRILLKELGRIQPQKVARNLQTIVDTGRWDDLFIFTDGSNPAIEVKVWEFISKQLKSDASGMSKNAPISILAKWMPSVNTSSQETRKLARRACRYLGLTERTYRKTLSALRAHLDVVERKMSAGKWNEIDFESVPSVAMSRYIKTYNKRCQERFAAYKAALVKGDAKVNAATLYPYDITYKALYQSYGRLDEVDEAQWKALPNYVNGEYDVVVMADVSGSMSGKPMATAIGLATYFAQRNKGAYHNLFMTFSSAPAFIQLEDSWSLRQCIDHVRRSPWGLNTNLDKALELIYLTALKTREVPKALVIISDGQFDRDYRPDEAQSIISKWNDRLRKAGLSETRIVSWNVAARQHNYIGIIYDDISFCSGAGVGPFNDLRTLIECNAYEAMVKILSKDVYSWK